VYSEYPIQQGKSTYIKQRTGNDIWKNLYDFPLIESEGKIPTKKIKQKISSFIDSPGDLIKISKPKEYKHILTHQIIYARFYVIDLLGQPSILSQITNSNDEFIQVNMDSIFDYPVPRLIDKFLKENNIFNG